MWNSSVWENWLDRILRDLVRLGTLRTTYPSGRTESYGTGAPVVPITLDDPALPRRLILNPDLALGEAYMDGTLRIGQDDLYGLLSLILTNLGPHRTLRQHRPIDFLRRLARGVLQFNPIPRAQRNVAHHHVVSRAAERARGCGGAGSARGICRGAGGLGCGGAVRPRARAGQCCRPRA